MTELVVLLAVLSRRGDAVLELVLALEVVRALERTGHGDELVVGHANRLEGWNRGLLILLLMDDHGIAVGITIGVAAGVDAGGPGRMIEKKGITRLSLEWRRRQEREGG